MGVPAFYRWLSSRYPKTIQDCKEETADVVNGVEVPVDTSLPNPNGIEYDNLYLDMNGIIHPCFHPEDKPAPTTENEVFQAIFEYIDRLFGIVRPRKVLYMAIDGVAPRAKMNQQRSRRFRAAQDAEEQARTEEKLREELALQGIQIPDKTKSDVFDSNTITPGTPFMHRLSIALQYYIHLRLNADPGWQHVKVILSDANCPGEGEHKVMAYIREQRNSPDYDPLTRHCVYGLDADLIMLALSTHEPRFSILREVVTPPPPKQDSARASAAQYLINKQNEEEQKEKPQIAKKPYQFLHVGVLREYLAMELSVNVPFDLDKERLYDDFVFICFFVGNDFLPHMPTLEIREGAIDLLMSTYRRMLPSLGHLVDGPHVLLDRVEKFISSVGECEGAIFQKRMRLLNRQKQRRQQQKRNQNNSGHGFDNRSTGNRKFESNKWGARTPAHEVAQQAVAVASHISKSKRMEAAVRSLESQANASAAQQLRDKMKNITGTKREASNGNENESKLGKMAKYEDSNAAKDAWAALAGKPTEPESSAKQGEEEDLETKSHASTIAEEMDQEEAEEHIEHIVSPVLEKDLTESEKKEAVKNFKDKLKEQEKDKADMFDQMVEHEERIRLHEPGFKDRYYSEKLGMQPGEELQACVADMVKSYVEGLCWVMRYYYDGVASWTWYYPYHYAPFASDLSNIGKLNISFEVGEPFKPFDQLMGVLPAASAHALPKPYQPLFTDNNSPLLDFYPKTFGVDMNGKRFAWQGVALLPFIDEKRLLKATREKEPLLTEEEQFRNSRRLETLFVSGANSLVADIFEIADSAGSVAPDEQKREHAQEMDSASSDGMAGYILPPNGDPCPAVVPCPFQGLGDDITSNSVVCCVYMLPEHKPHITKLLPGAVEDEPILTPADMPDEPQIWHQESRYGRHDGGVQRNHYNNNNYNGYRPRPPSYGSRPPPPSYRPQFGLQQPGNMGPPGPHPPRPMRPAFHPPPPQGYGHPRPLPSPGGAYDPRGREGGAVYRNSNNPYDALRKHRR